MQTVVRQESKVQISLLNKLCELIILLVAKPTANSQAWGEWGRAAPPSARHKHEFECAYVMTHH